MKQKYSIILLIILLMLFGLMGCSSKTNYGFDTDESLVYIQKDDSIISIFVEDFDEDKYSEDELEAVINDEIDDYNEKYADNEGISLVNLDFTKSVATLEIKYNSAADYSAYNTNYVYYGTPINFFMGSIEKLTEQGNSFDGEFNEIGKDDKTSVVTKEDFEDQDELKVIIMNEGINARVKGTILYTSTNVTVKDGLATTTSGENNYIIYK